MDLAAIELKLESGEDLKLKYRYPIRTKGAEFANRYAVRSDKLLDVSVELRRFYTNFRGEVPIWIEADEVIEVTPDDGVYVEFPDE